MDTKEMEEGVNHLVQAEDTWSMEGVESAHWIQYIMKNLDYAFVLMVNIWITLVTVKIHSLSHQSVKKENTKIKIKFV